MARKIVSDAASAAAPAAARANPQDSESNNAISADVERMSKIQPVSDKHHSCLPHLIISIILFLEYQHSISFAYG